MILETMANLDQKERSSTLILRHRKENRSKCTLTPLEDRDDLHFLVYPRDLATLSFPSTGTLVLVMGAPELPIARAPAPLLLIDGTWRYAKTMWTQVQRHHRGPFLQYSLPRCWTAYPRRQTECEDPEAGLASIEALYVAHACLGRPTEGLLDHYHWKEEFLSKNQALFERIATVHALA